MEEREKKKIRTMLKQKVTVSMKVPLMILLLLFGMIPMVLATQTAIISMEQNQTDSRMIEVQNRCQILSNKMTRSGYFLSGGDEYSIDNEIETIANIYNGRIVLVDKNFRIVLDTFKIAENRLHIAEEVIRCFQGETGTKLNRNKHYFFHAVPVYNAGAENVVDGVIVFTASTEEFSDLSEKVGDKLLLFHMIAFLLLAVLGWGAAMVLLHPFRDLQKKLGQVADGALDTDISEKTYKETYRISRAVEQTLCKLKEVDQSRQEFVSNVSHELKTPITSIRVLADSLMGMGDVPVELYREFMEDISGEIDRESQIIDDLLSLVKMDKSEAELNVAQTSINVLVEQIMKRLRPIANKKNVELIFESIRDVSADVDEVKLTLAITNLIENAIKYNMEAGWVRVTLDADHKFFYIKVADSGIGIPEEAQDRIFERFYRVDKARSREMGGSGLGLAITRSVVLMHKGAIKLNSKEGEGSVFTIRIPLNYIAAAGGKS
ncbi:MAG: sensor histidine kinase [Brotaphodocola sp.]